MKQMKIFLLRNIFFIKNQFVFFYNQKNDYFYIFRLLLILIEKIRYFMEKVIINHLDYHMLLIQAILFV
jgi:hypothetical protein